MSEAFQYTLPSLSEDQPDIVRIKLSRPGEPLIPLSSSRLENITHAMQHPEIPVEQFSQPSTDKQIAIEAGKILHLAVEMIDINTAAQPAETHDVPQIHHHNLIKLTARMAPTEKRPVIRLALAILDNDRFAHPNLHAARKTFASAHKSIALEIAGEVVKEAKRDMPFTVNLPFPETELEETNDDLLAEWNRRGMDQLVLRAVGLLMDQRQDQTVTPADYGPGGSFSEPRLNALLFQKKVSFSASPDNLVSVHMPEDKFVRVTDYKTGRKFFPKTEAGQIAIKASLHLLAQMGLALPDKIKPTGTSIKVQVRDIRAIKPGETVEIRHIILSDPPQIIDPLAELGVDLRDPRQASLLDQDFADLVETIRHDERLKPLLTRKKK
jgi:hypothetical protein